MNEMELRLNQYYERVGISPVCCEDPPKEMFNNFRCPNKVACKNYCEASGEFEFQPRIEGVEFSQCYYNRAFSRPQHPPYCGCLTVRSEAKFSLYGRLFFTTE